MLSFSQIARLYEPKFLLIIMHANCGTNCYHNYNYKISSYMGTFLGADPFSKSAKLRKELGVVKIFRKHD